jgi:hypothetical protein
MKRLLTVLLFSSFFLKCTPVQDTANSSRPYFDLKTYFKNEAQLLQRKNPAVIKTVTKNDLRESKTIHVRSWENELGLFSESDINKSAWKDEYEVTKIGNEIQYLAKNSKLKTKTIVINKSANGKINHIFILNEVNNHLYSSREELHYFPDSLYSIGKKQKIQILGSNDYTITGRIMKTSK